MGELQPPRKTGWDYGLCEVVDVLLCPQQNQSLGRNRKTCSTPRDKERITVWKPNLRGQTK